MNKESNAAGVPLVTLWIVIALVVLAWVVFAWTVFGVIAGTTEQKGQFGDAFGALNTLFSGLAFALIIYTVLLQRRELELQRREMESTREELKGQKDQLALQNRLTVRAAQLAALPLLMEEESKGIATLGGGFANWTSQSYSTQELQEIAARYSNEIPKRQDIVTRLQARLDALTAANSSEASLVRSNLHKAQQSHDRAARAVPRLHRLIGYRQHLEAVYDEMKTA